MSANMNMNMNMNMAMGGSSIVTNRGSVVPELGDRVLTLDFTPVGGASPYPDFDLLKPLPTTYRPKLWNTSLRALLYLPEFLETPHPVLNKRWNELDKGTEFAQFLRWTDDPAFVLAEVSQLAAFMQDYRERYLPEVIDQHDNFVTPWLSLLGIDRTHRWCVTLIQAALRIGEIVVMHYKLAHARPRPSHVCPALTPPFGPPGHPSFPSGHALQSRLVAHALNEMTQADGTFPWHDQLFWLSDRMAINREYAGLHYRSDSDAGKYLADQCWAIWTQTKSLPGLLQSARETWSGPA